MCVSNVGVDGVLYAYYIFILKRNVIIQKQLLCDIHLEMMDLHAFKASKCVSKIFAWILLLRPFENLSVGGATF